MAMEWVLLMIGAAAVTGVVSILRRGGHLRWRPSVAEDRRGTRAEQGDRPHRHVANYRASGALPRWDP
jgi:hypothetical protein